MFEIICTSCCIKKHIIEQDEQEIGLRSILNFGHTIGHAIEVVENYHISHGQAVAIGMLVECYLSVLSGWLEPKVVKLLKDVFKSLDIKLTTVAFRSIDFFRQMLILDKKAKGYIPHFVLLDRVGQVHRTGTAYTACVSDDLLVKALRWAEKIRT